MRLLDPAALRGGELRIVPIRELPRVDLELTPAWDIDQFAKPGSRLGPVSLGAAR